MNKKLLKLVDGKNHDRMKPLLDTFDDGAIGRVALSSFGFLTVSVTQNGR